MKILVIAPSWIGDLIMSQCLYRTLKKMYPDGILHVMAPKWCISILSRMPEVDRAILMPIGHGEFNIKGRWQQGRCLSLTKYDLAIILPNSWKSALIPFFAKIPDRRGFKGEMRWGLINHIRKNKNEFPKLVERYTSLAYNNSQVKKNTDIPEILPPSLKVEQTDSCLMLKKFGIDINSRPLGICPGAEFGPAKKWPSKYYAEIIKKWILKFPQREVWLFGSKKDNETSNEIMQSIDTTDNIVKNKIHVLTGYTTMEEAIDLLAVCKLVISNDSGLMHTAAAVNCKITAIFGSTSTSYTPPTTNNCLLIESKEPCHPCFKRQCRLGTFQCLKNISPDYVWNCITEKWKDL